MRPVLKDTQLLLTTGALVLAGFALSACGGGESLGFGKVTPDEFRVVAKAPLTLPPEYALRPPTPGEPRPQELQPESAARLAVLGQQAAVQRSDGEKLLSAKVGAAKADPLIRYVVDDEFGEVAHKDRSFADKVMFWKKPAPDAIAQASARAAAIEASSPLNPSEEEARIKAAIGSKPVLIKRAPDSALFKLPGL
jgi:Protein of unknown function (DUF3035)